MLVATKGSRIVALGAALMALPCVIGNPALARPQLRLSASHTVYSHAAASPFRGTLAISLRGFGMHGFGGPIYSLKSSVPLRNAMFTRGLSKYGFSKTGKARYMPRGGYSYEYGGLQCVPFARAASGIELKGNAALWWEAAAGVYERGSRPEPGSVLNFRATGHMRLGHVAVVTAVTGPREIEVDHANWGGSYGGVSRHVAVMDVSADNDWSEVRVALGRTGEFGSTYPTYGFIYDRPDNGMMTASNAAARRLPPQGFDEVAEAPLHPRGIIRAKYSR